MIAIQDDPERRELERRLMLWLNATGDLSAQLARERDTAPNSRRIVLDVLDSHLDRARAAAESALAVTMFSSR